MNVRTTALLGELRTHPLWRQDTATTKAGGLGPRHRSAWHFLVRLWLENLELNSSTGILPVTCLPVALLVEPSIFLGSASQTARYGILSDVFNLLFPLRLVPDDMVEAFLVPERAFPPKNLVDLLGREALDAMKYFTQCRTAILAFI